MVVFIQGLVFTLLAVLIVLAVTAMLARRAGDIAAALSPAGRVPLRRASAPRCPCVA